MTATPGSVSMQVAGASVVICGATLSGGAGNVAAGSNFLVHNNVLGCTETGAEAGEVYDITISLQYDVAIGGVTTSHTETGTLRGPLE